jgi:asparagine synthase (glutamine-hydrolysing)
VCSRESSNVDADSGRATVLKALGGPLFEGLGQLIGEFAFLAWNRKTGVLIAARDPLASRPLFWASGANRLAIASKVPALLAQPGFERRPDEGAIAELICERPSTVEATVWDGVSRLIGGRALVFDARGFLKETVQFWSARSGPAPERPAPALRDSVARAVQRRARVGERIACELSGGLDSSTVLGVALSLGVDAIPYSTVEPGQPWDETPLIEETLRHCGLRGRLVGVSPPSLDQRRECVRRHGLIGDYVLGGEEPRRVAATDGCQVILTGDFGDEVLGGTALGDADGLCRLQLRSVRRLLMGPARRTLGATAFRDQLRSVLGYQVRRQWQPPLPFWVSPDLARRVRLRDRMASAEAKPSKGPPSFRYFASLLQNWWTQSRSDLGDVDVSPRAEDRTPLADLQLVELALRIPESQKCQDGDRRYLHRQAFGDVLSPAVRRSREKAEFSAMIHAHLEAGPDLLRDKPSIVNLGWVNGDGLDRLRAEVLSARPTRAYTRHLWVYATLNELELWARELVA